MGTREVYEEKLRSGNLFREPTMNPGLGSPRCPRCLSLINPNLKKGEWTITSIVHDATSVAGAGGAAMFGAVHGFNRGLPIVQQYARRPMVQMLIMVPPVVLFSGISAALGGFAVPSFAQLSVTSYYAASSASHYAISQATRYIEEKYHSEINNGKSS